MKTIRLQKIFVSLLTIVCTAFLDQTSLVRAATISAIPDQTVDEGTATAEIPFTISPGSGVLSGFSSNPNLVPDINVTFGGSGTARTVKVTPKPNQNGTADIFISFFDPATGGATRSFKLTVTAVNDPPSANAQSLATDEDTAKSGTLTGSDPDGDSLTFAKATDPAHGTVTINSDGSFTYTPVANYNGPDSFTFTANDGKANSAPATVSITVNANAPSGHSIGLNFGANEARSALAPTDEAGAVPQRNWNNLTGANGNAAVVRDSSGNAVPGVSVTWSSPSTWSTTGRGEENNGFAAGGDHILMTGYLDTTEVTAGKATITVSGLPTAFTGTGYDVIVYCVGGVPGRGGAYTIGGATKYGTAPLNPSTHSEDPGVGLADTGTHITFTGLTGSAFTLTANADASINPFGTVSFRAPVNGIQITANSATPLAITEQPSSLYLPLDAMAAFSVRATGSPLYQWYFNGAEIPGALLPTYTIPAVQRAHAGEYTVVVSNPAGSVTSAVAKLTVNESVCVTPGTVGLWLAEGNADDTLGSHNGTLQNGASIVPGRGGNTFCLDGVDDYVNLGPWTPGGRWTLAAWVNVRALPSGRHNIVGAVAEFGDGAIVLQDGKIGAAIRPPDPPYFLTVNSGIAPIIGEWYHVAATCDGTNAVIYVNGQARNTNAVDLNYVVTPSGVRIGGSVCCTSDYFAGCVDDVAINNRPLTPIEIQTNYALGGAGKCPEESKITQQPAGQIVVAGGPATFNVLATGSPPPSYQWRVNGVNISGATNPTLTLNGVTPAQGGNYSVFVNNSSGAVTSSNAMLDIKLNTPPWNHFAYSNVTVNPAAGPQVISNFVFNLRPGGSDFNFSTSFDSLSPAESLNGVATITGGALNLTKSNDTNAYGVYTLNLNSNVPVRIDSLSAKWRSYIGDGTGLIQYGLAGADGYSVNIAADLPNPPTYGNPGEDGAGSGLSVTVDTFDNGGGEAPGIEMKWGGQRVASSNIDPDPGTAKAFLLKNRFVDASLNWIYTELTFSYDGKTIKATLPGYNGFDASKIMIGARTESGAAENHSIDNLNINLQSSFPWESNQTVIFLVTNSNPNLFSSQPFIDNLGTLYLTPSSNACGTAEVTVRAMDNGGTAFGGNDTSLPSRFLTYVTCASNRCPVFLGSTVTVVTGQPTPFTLNVTDPNNNPLNTTVVGMPLNGTLSGSALNFIYNPSGTGPYFDNARIGVTDGSCSVTGAVNFAIIDTLTTGSANVRLTNGTFIVTNIGGGGGLSIISPPSSGISLVPFPGGAMPSGSGISIQYSGLLNGSIQTVANMTVMNSGNNYVYSNPYAGLSTRLVGLMVRSNGVPIAGTTNFNSDGKVTTTALHTVASAFLGSLSVGAKFAPGTWITVAGIEYQADEMVFRIEPTGTLDYLTGVTVTGIGLDSFTISDVQVQLVPPRLAIARASGNVVLSWDAPGFRLQSATNLNPPVSWTDVSGASPVTVQPSGGPKFYRIVSP